MNLHLKIKYENISHRQVFILFILVYGIFKEFKNNFVPMKRICT